MRERLSTARARRCRGTLTLLLVLLALTASSLVAAPVAAQAEDALPIPALRLDVGAAGSPGEQVTSLQILLVLTVLAVAPAILILMTAFTRIVIVLSFVRTSLGVQTLPPNQVLMGLALFLTLFVMAPTFRQVHSAAWVPYSEGRLSQADALTAAMEPMKEFMLGQTRKKDLDLMLQLSAQPRPEGPEDVPALSLIPAFAISELRTAFQMGFLLFLPFVVIDLVVASTMMSMGMMMVPPALVSLPFKVLVFVLADGWHLVVRSLAVSFAT